MEKNIISYANILESINAFKKRHNNSIYNPMDEPGTFFFKIMFYFNNPGEPGGFTSNLLGLDLLDNDVNTGVSTSKHGSDNTNQGLQKNSQAAGTSQNTAYNFLVINDEQERAAMLKNFIFLLSEISSESPWYFKSVSGLDSANDRSYLKDFKLEEKRSITINCLQEAIDTRITTLLELYRGACFSHAARKEIIPANLRKFDMGIYIFQTPIYGMNYTNKNKEIGIPTSDASAEFTNSKYFEFHNCEIDLESLKTCYGEPDNEKGFSIEPKITINYDDCFISSYNEDLCQTIGDLVRIDIDSRYDAANYVESTNTAINNKTSISQSDTKQYEVNTAIHTENSKTESDIMKPNPIKKGNTYDLYVNPDYKYRDNGKLSQLLLDSTVGKLSTKVGSLFEKAYLGNVYGVSMRNMVGSVQQLMSGDLYGGIQTAVKQVVNTANSVKNKTVVSDLLPSIVTKKGNIVAQNIFRNI